ARAARLRELGAREGVAGVLERGERVVARDVAVAREARRGHIGLERRVRRVGGAAAEVLEGLVGELGDDPRVELEDRVRALGLRRREGRIEPGARRIEVDLLALRQ